MLYKTIIHQGFSLPLLYVTITCVLQWQQLHDILLRTTDTERRETEQSEAERRQRLRDASDELQRGWSDNEHDKVSLFYKFIET